MKLLETKKFNEQKVQFYQGIDVEMILQHPRDGSKGIMIIFFESLEKEKMKLMRYSTIKTILGESYENVFEKIINLDNPNIILYETQGFMDVIYRSVITKLENNTLILNI